MVLQLESHMHLCVETYEQPDDVLLLKCGVLAQFTDSTKLGITQGFMWTS